jgi:uncharacterized protein (TIGR03435 family)
MMHEPIAHLRYSRRSLLLLAASLLALAAPAALAQTAPPTASQATDSTAKLPAFDVISIRPAKNSTQPGSGGGTFSFSSRTGIRTSPDGFSASNIDLKTLIANAYGVKVDQISGGPGWIDSNRYDIEAKVVAANGSTPQPIAREQRSLMLRSLLADRFKLAVHNETKELPVFDLVVANKGPKLQPAKPDEPSKNSTTFSNSSVQLTATAVQLSALATQLSYQLHSPIIDKTGLTGTYDITLQWAPDQGAAGADSPGPSIFTAVQEQLGLKLNPSKGPVDTLVIDHVQQPTAN